MQRRSGWRKLNALGTLVLLSPLFRLRRVPFTWLDPARGLMKTLPPYFVPDSDLPALQQRIEQALSPHEILWETACFSWACRERDAKRAQSLAREVLAQTTNHADPHSVKLVRALALNTLAELCVLQGNLTQARTMAREAQRLFEALNCQTGVGDAHLIYAAVAWDRSETASRAEELELARALYAESGDTAREQIARVRLAHNDSYDNPSGTYATWQPWLDQQCETGDSSVAALALEARGSFAFSRADYAQSVRDYHNAYQTGLVTGQTRLAIVSLIGVGISVTNLGDPAASMEWLERALGMARDYAWPVLLGQALQQYAMPFVTMQRWDAARGILKESIEVLQPFSPSRRAALSQAYWGELAHETGDFTEALRSYRLVQDQADQIDDQDLRISAAIGQARALASLGCIEEALDYARIGFAMSRSVGERVLEITALRTLANIHRRCTSDGKTHLQTGGSAIEYLEQALEVAQSIEGFMADAELYAELARDYANANDYRKAYETEQRGTQARKQTYSKEATDRVTALQVRYDTERASARTEHLEAMAKTLQQVLETLELLGEIGKEITAKLDPQSVFDALNRHLGRLMDATHLSIFQMIDTPPRLKMSFGISAGVPLAPMTIMLDEPLSKIARCARERAEIHQDEPSPPGQARPFPGTIPSASMAYLPLIANNELLGVLSVQSPIPHSYGQRELLVLRTLCAYGAVALANATVVAELHQTQNKLVAAMGTLQQLATHDALTGATNRGGFYAQASEEISRTRLHGMNLSVILFDLDHFKDINDTWGHAVGDEVLQAVVRISDQHSHVPQQVARIGGEEFALLLPEVDLPHAAEIARRLCTSLASTPLQTKRSVITITASFSVACLDAHDLNIDDLLARADTTLYEAKHAGRNRVHVAEMTSLT